MKITDIFVYKIPAFIRNFFCFINELWKFRGYDWSYSLMMFRRSIEIQLKSIEKYSLEISPNKDNKIEKIKQSIELLKFHEQDIFFAKDEKEKWDELFKILEDDETGLKTWWY